MVRNSWIKLSLLAWLVTGCSGVGFNDAGLPNVPQSPGDTPVCQPGQIETFRPTKVLFLVDQSGSNKNGPFNAPGQATDPDKIFRSSVINSFFNLHRGKAHLGWSFIAFNGTTATPLMPGFGSDAEFTTALSDFVSRQDVGNTPYRAALAAARAHIAADIASSNDPNLRYLIAFITDGNPTDYCPDPSEVLCPGMILENEIDTDVAAIRDLASSRVQFSTVYYGPPDSEAASLLARMASVGTGQFVDLNAESNIDLNDVLKVPGPSCE